MFGPPGHAYVYFIYGMHHCLNVVTAARGTPHAVLIRAVEPISGIELPTWGPGLVASGLGIHRNDNGLDLRTSRIQIVAARGSSSLTVVTAARINVAYAGDWAALPWRFLDADSPFVSRDREGRAPRRRVIRIEAGDPKTPG